MRPVVFNQTIGWLHPAAGTRGVVVAGAHGFEDLCSRRFLTLLARRLAEAGLPVLQFDYPGCGDAAGDHTEPARVPAWIASIGQAIERLKAETGVSDVLVVGFRLGALLAPAAIAGRDDVAGLALLAPPSSGKAYVREMNGLSRMIDGALPPGTSGSARFDGIEAAGFRISAETAADLRAMEWRDRTASAGLDLLLMPAQPAPLHAELAEQVVALGGAARVEPFSGFTRLMSSPTANEIPQAALDTIVGWAALRGRPTDRTIEPIMGAPAMLEEDSYRELPVVLDAAPEICGVLCMPADGPPGGEVVLILNAGAIPHLGWARGAVDMARGLARRGIASMRVDLPGLGQSGEPDDKRLFLYDERGRNDVIRIVDWLQQQGIERVCAIGTCAGAYQAFHAARFDRRITRLAMVNPLCFWWNSSYALDMGLAKIRDNAGGSLKLDEDAEPAEAPAPSSSRRRLTFILSWLARRALRLCLEVLKSALSRAGEKRSGRGQSVERWMRDLTRRGTRVLLVSAEGDLSFGEIARHFGPDGRRLRRMEGVTLTRLKAADHTLTPLHARNELFELVLRLLGRADAK